MCVGHKGERERESGGLGYYNARMDASEEGKMSFGHCGFGRERAMNEHACRDFCGNGR